MSPVSHPRIESFVDRLTEPLQHTAERERLEEVRANALFHIESLVESHQGEGDPIGLALDEYGSAEELGMAMLDEWCRGTQAVTFAKTASSATWWSFAFFGIAEALTMVLLEITAISPGGLFVKPLAAGAVWVAPAVAGFLTGRFVPTGNLRAFAIALLPLAIHTAVSALLVGPYLGNADFALPALLLWIPIGGTSLTFSAWLRRSRPSARRLDSRLGASI